MSEDKICFNKELLESYDPAANWYRDIATEIAGGEMPTAEEPCVPDYFVQPSFKMSGLDASNPEDVFFYADNLPYFQTAACELAWTKDSILFHRNPEDVIPLLDPVAIDQNKWQKYPGFAIKELDPVSQAVTAAFQITNAPVSKAVLDGALDYLPLTCAQFSLIELYYATDDRELKNQYAQKLLDKFRTQSDDYYGEYKQFTRDDMGDIPNIYRESWPALYGIFFDLFNNYKGDWSRMHKESAANAMITIGGASALAYLTDIVLKPFAEKDWDTDTSNAALWALQIAARERHDAIPFVIKILQSENASKLNKQVFWARMDGTQKMVTDTRLLPIITDRILEDTGYSGSRDGQYLDYMQSAGVAAIPFYLKLLKTDKPDFSRYFRQNVLEKLASMDEPAARAVLKGLIDNDELAKFGLDQRRILYHMATSYSPCSHRTLISMLEGTKEDDILYKPLLDTIGYINNDFESAKLAFDKLFEVAKRPGGAVAEGPAMRSMRKLAERYQNLFFAEFLSLPMEQQYFLLSNSHLTLTNRSEDLFIPGEPLGHYGDPKLSPEVQRHLEAMFVGAVHRAVEENRETFDLAAYLIEPRLEGIRDRIWDNAIGGVPSSSIVRVVADSSKVPEKYRLLALKYMAGLNEAEIDDVLLNDFVRNPNLPEWLRDAALDGLGKRAKSDLPAIRDDARAALNSIAPLPKSITDKARQLQKSLK